MFRLIPHLIVAALAVFGGAAGAQVEAGRALFVEGAGARALLADGAVDVPASRFPCAGCHGADGRGGVEGATEFPALITGAAPRFDRTALAAALLEGTGADGRTLSSAMPRYRTDPATLDALHAYIAALADAGRIGVAAGALHITPPSDPARRAAFAAGLDEANREGGAWGRRFALVDPPAGAVVAADEVVAGLAEAAAERRAALIATELRRRDIRAVALGTPDDALTVMLEDLSVDVLPDAGAQIEIGAPGVVLVEADGTRTTLVAPPKDDALATLSARHITRAAIACGRGVTRRCLLGALAVLHLEP